MTTDLALSPEARDALLTAHAAHNAASHAATRYFVAHAVPVRARADCFQNVVLPADRLEAYSDLLDAVAQTAVAVAALDEDSPEPVECESCGGLFLEDDDDVDTCGYPWIHPTYCSSECHRNGCNERECWTDPDAGRD